MGENPGFWGRPGGRCGATGEVRRGQNLSDIGDFGESEEKESELESHTLRPSYGRGRRRAQARIPPGLGLRCMVRGVVGCEGFGKIAKSVYVDFFKIDVEIGPELFQQNFGILSKI